MVQSERWSQEHMWHKFIFSFIYYLYQFVALLDYFHRIKDMAGADWWIFMVMGDIQ
jgi:hypothetical protein